MTSTTKLFELAQLAEASYANFINSNTNQALTDQNFSLAQATELVANWQVISQQPNTLGGYSGTLFKYIGNDPNSGFANGEYVFSLRGTEPDYIINSIDLAVDLGDIAVDGLAFGQIIDMYNHWTQINTAAGQSYQRAVLLPVNGGVVYPPSSYIVDQPTGITYAIVFLDSATSYPMSDPRSYGLGAMLQSGGLTVTGHSLGGHLASVARTP